MSRIDQQSVTDSHKPCQGACDKDCGRCEGAGLRLAGAMQEDTSEVDILTRGLLGNFKSFITTGEASASHRPQSEHPTEPDVQEEPTSEALDEALGRIEAAMAALASSVPNLEERLAGVEARVDDFCDIEWVEDGSDADPHSDAGVDREAVATSLKDRLAMVERECERLASVPIERVETRVCAAERTLGGLVERAEAAVKACVSEREAAERAAERLETLAGALAPWVELLELRETEDGLPKPLSGLLKAASAELAREMAGVRGSLERFAGVLEIPASPDVCEAQPQETTEFGPKEGGIVTPQEPDEGGSRQRGRKNGKPRAVKAKGADAEAPRRGASESRLSAAARLRARSRAEGRPPRR